MKTNETNELDEILIKFNEEMINGAVNDFGTEHHEDGYKPIVEKAKQQINKWALEKCLRVIGETLKRSFVSDITLKRIEYLDITDLGEKARKEFYE